MRKFITAAAIISMVTLLIGLTVRPSRSQGQFYFYWAQTGVATNNRATCYSFGESVLRSEGFQNIRRSPGEVTGSKGGVYAAITCVATTPQATAVVAAVGNYNNDASRIRDVLRDKIRGVRGY